MSIPLTKNNSLKNHSDLEMLFKNGDKLTSPLISLYYVQSYDKNLKIVFSVGKKKHKLAVDRNKIKRLMKESFRLGAFDYIVPSISYHFAFIYIDDKVPKLSEVNKSMNSLLLSFKNNVLC